MGGGAVLSPHQPPRRMLWISWKMAKKRTERESQVSERRAKGRNGGEGLDPPPRGLNLFLPLPDPRAAPLFPSGHQLAAPERGEREVPLHNPPLPEEW